MGLKVAVVGATGNVGREILSILGERKFPASDVVALASQHSVGKEVSYGEGTLLKVQNLDTYSFDGCHLALSSAGSTVAKKFAPRATQAGCIVIDNSSGFRREEGVPLVVPEVNGHELDTLPAKGIVANPNCVALPITVALKSLHEQAGIKRVVVSSYQSVSGAGRRAMDELFAQTRNIMTNQPLKSVEFPKQIAFNLIPQIGDFEADGFTDEEEKVMYETQHILGGDFDVVATCVRVPVFIGHSISVAVEFNRPITPAEARDLLKRQEGVILQDRREDGGYITPLECTGMDPVYVSRLRKDPTVPYGLMLWVVADNLRKGAALNTVQIAEYIAKKHFADKIQEKVS